MPFPEGQERTDVALREVLRARRAPSQGPERIEPIGAAGEQKAILEELAFGELHQAERYGEERCVEVAGLHSRYEILARRFPHVELDPGPRGSQVLEQPREEVWRKGGHDPEDDPERTRLETLSHRLEKQHLVEDPERLLMCLLPEHGQAKTSALAQEERGAASGLQLADLKRKRRLRDEYAFRCPPQRAVLNYRIEIAELAQCDGHASLLVVTGARFERPCRRRRAGCPAFPPGATLSRTPWGSAGPFHDGGQRVHNRLFGFQGRFEHSGTGNRGNRVEISGLAQPRGNGKEGKA